MKKIFHNILSALLHGLAHLPFWALYLHADVIYFVMCHIVRYRRKVIIDNLQQSYPDKPKEWIKSTARRFYRNFSDYIVETIKLLHISDDEMRRRMVFENTEAIDRIFDNGQSIVIYFSHCFNWEWAPSITLWSKYKTDTDAVYAQVYRPLRDKWFDALMLKVRSRFGSHSFAKSHVLRDLITLRREQKLSITGFMSDQKPSHGDPTHIMMFLNHPTAMITGTETLARRLGMAAIYWDIEKVKRGHYKLTTRVIGTDLSEFPPMGVTETYAQMLQTTIDRDPAIWLWSHKRWKFPVTMPDASETTKAN